ncbi:MAG: UDP-N-acetylmuramoyl-L-alanyl-D-glutamate--2,6-diaminopimelate ligase, partial [Planctomycetota bacterium]|nr:UDP-N-acetylmuramoyl-L-alanyl-D-glutamate--2,6-diaminopimelate ligase [Planctomycetota bacterium]
HDYIAEAVKRGAAAVVCERLPRGSIRDKATFVLVDDSRKSLVKICSEWFARPSEKIACLGVTGTNGKTTTAFLIQHILNKCGILTDLIGTIFYDVGGEIFPSSNTTPGVLTLHKLLSKSVSAGREAVVMEVSSHSLAQGRTAGISFQVGVLTNIASDHLDYHKTHRDYVEAKKLLFKSLKPSGIGVVNRDSPHWEEFAGCCAAGVVKYSLKNDDVDVKADIEMKGFDGMNLWIEIEEDTVECRLPLVGVHNCENALAAVSVGYFEFGLSLEEIGSAIKSFKGVPGRLELLSKKDAPFKVLVDYAHTEGALAAALKALRPVCEGRLVVVFGCGGDRDRTKRPKMAEVAERLSDMVVVTSDNPRTEEPLAIIEEIVKGFTEPKRHKIIPDRREAIETAIRMARKGDVVLIAGKGHENYQIVKDKILPFDDRKVAREVLGDVA